MSRERCEQTLFVSDIHLSPDEPATVERFLAFLQVPAREATRLTILGDLFDYWAGDDDLGDPFNARIVAALRAVADAGVTLAFMAGNRDFLIGDDFAAAANLSLLPDPCVRDVAGVATLLSHGDSYCTDDADYQRFRREVRDPAWRSNFLAQPLATRKAQIAALRIRSETEKKTKTQAIMDVNDAAVADALRQHGVTTLIHGHTHRQAQHSLRIAGQPGKRWVLGDWHGGDMHSRGTALACATAGWHFLD